MENKNPEFTLTGTINYELKFGDKGVHLTWNDQTNPAKLVSLLISHELAENAKANFNANMEAIKNDKVMMDRLNWAGKTAKGLEVFISPFLSLVVDENIFPAMKVEEKGGGNSVITLQDIPTEE